MELDRLKNYCKNHFENSLSIKNGINSHSRKIKSKRNTIYIEKVVLIITLVLKNEFVSKKIKIIERESIRKMN